MSEKDKPFLNPEPEPADADGSEERATPFSALNSDDAENYDPDQDDLSELEKLRIHDK